jgi:hypothetical protein
MTTPNEEKLGVFYQILGGISLVGGIAAALLGQSYLTVLVLAVVCLALIRPTLIADWVKTLADKLPFLSYKKPLE